MARYSIEDTTLTNIANAIREKTGSTNPVQVANMAEEISGISGSSVDVTEETNAYTTKLASLETAVAALETELEGKASGGSGNSGEWICVASLPTTLASNPESSGATYCYYEVPENCCAVILRHQLSGDSIMSYYNSTNSYFSGASLSFTGGYLEISDADHSGIILKVGAKQPTTTYILPIYANVM